MYMIVFTKRAQKDKALLKQAGLDEKAKALLGLLSDNPLRTPPSCEKLSGDLRGCYSRRINLKHRMVYEIFEEEKTVKVLAMWTHYE